MNSFFLYGAPGTGKTTLACTAPKPILLIDIDKKASSMYNIKSLIDNEEVVIQPILSSFSEGTLREKLIGIKSPPSSMPQGMLEFSDVVTKLEEKCEYKTIIIDSLTTLNEHLKRYLLFSTKKIQLSFEGWDLVQQMYVNLFESLKIINCENLILIAHERIDKSDKGDNISKFIYRPLIESSMKDKFGIFFNEIYHCEIQELGNKPVWKVRTSPTDEIIARTSLKLDILEDPNISDILEKGVIKNDNQRKRIQEDKK